MKTRPLIYSARSFTIVQLAREPIAPEWEVAAYNPGASRPVRVWPRFVGRTAEGDARAYAAKLEERIARDGWGQKIRLREIASRIPSSAPKVTACAL